MSIADYVGIATLITAVLATALGAYWASRQPRNHDAEERFRPRPQTVALADEDRLLLRHLTEALTGHRKAIDDHAETVARHRHAVGDHTAQLRRD